MANDKDPFDDDLMAPPAEDEVMELEDSGLGVEELTEVDETQSNVVDGSDFGDIDLEAPVEDLPTFVPPSAPRAATVSKTSAPQVPELAPGELFTATATDTDSSAEIEQQSFGFEEPQASAAELSAAGEDSLSQAPRPSDGKNKKLMLAVVGIAGVALVGGLAVFMLSGNQAPTPTEPVAYEAEAVAPVAAVTEPVTAAVDAEPEPEVAPAPVAPVPEPAPEPKLAPKPVAKPEPKAEAKPAQKAAAKPVAEKTKPVAAAPSGEAASRLLSVEVSTGDGKDVVRFVFDGAAPAKIGSFALKASASGESARYVVDFFGIDSGSTKGAGTGQFVTGIRSGKHEGKFRAVLDLTTDSVVAKRRVEGNAVIVELR